LDKLKVKHEDKYTPEQFQAWVHRIQMQKYESYENLHDKPFLGKSRKKILLTAT